MENKIEIQTYPDFLPERSDPLKPYYFFSYRVKIINNSDVIVKLLSRYWHIKDGEGKSEDIHGPGVVGQTLAEPTHPEGQKDNARKIPRSLSVYKRKICEQAKCSYRIEEFAGRSRLLLEPSARR